MASIIIQGFDPATGRDIVKNNSSIKCLHFIVHTNIHWLPEVLAELGFFPSGNQVKKNRPDLWRDVVHGEIVKLKWVEVLVCLHGSHSVEREVTEGNRE